MSESLQNILVQGFGTIFCTFSNSDGKTWIMPQKNMSTAMNLYQPTGIRGKWMKKCFPYLYWIKPLQVQLSVTVSQYELQPNMKELLCRIFHSDTVDFSIFCGTPSVHQKITMQISKGSKILGYCKLSDKENIVNLFLYEQKTLETLKEKGVNQIPQCLYCAILDDNVSLFVQSTMKSNRSKILHQWSDLHWNFLCDLKERTEKKLPFEQTDFFRNINLLQHNQSYLPDNERIIIDIALTEIYNYYKNETVKFSVYHGDFTPWNMFVEKKQLFVFDWEYASSTYPSYMDQFHFFTQCCIFDRHLNSEKIFQSYIAQKHLLVKYIENPDFIYLCYLVDIILRYVNRDKGIYDKGMRNSLTVWLQLISFLIKCKK